MPAVWPATITDLTTTAIAVPAAADLYTNRTTAVITPEIAATIPIPTPVADYAGYTPAAVAATMVTGLLINHLLLLHRLGPTHPLHRAVHLAEAEEAAAAVALADRTGEEGKNVNRESAVGNSTVLSDS